MNKIYIISTIILALAIGLIIGYSIHSSNNLAEINHLKSALISSYELQDIRLNSINNLNDKLALCQRSSLG